METSKREALDELRSQLSQTLAPITSAIHAYDVFAAPTYVEGGEILPHYRE